jgi:ribosomal protein S27AE
MLEKIKPTKYQLTLIYECPNCQSSYPFDHSELNQNFRWSCGCGGEYFIEKIEDIKMGIAYRNISKPVIINEQSFIDSAVNYVFAMGYNREKINKIVDEIDTTLYDKKEELIRAILAKVDENA